MPSSDELNQWFDSLINTLPSHDDDLAAIFRNPPLGITQIKVPYPAIPLRRSGPKGWTYFPMAANGDRLVRISYHIPLPNVYVTAMVKLTDHDEYVSYDGDETITWTASGPAVVTIDNLNCHGRVEMRQSDNGNKRRKLVITHASK